MRHCKNFETSKILRLFENFEIKLNFESFREFLDFIKFWDFSRVLRFIENFHFWSLFWRRNIYFWSILVKMAVLRFWAEGIFVKSIILKFSFISVNFPFLRSDPSETAQNANSRKSRFLSRHFSFELKLSKFCLCAFLTFKNIKK